MLWFKIKSWPARVPDWGYLFCHLAKNRPGCLDRKFTSSIRCVVVGWNLGKPDSILPQELRKLLRCQLWPVVWNHVFWCSIVSKQCTLNLNGFQAGQGTHGNYLLPLGIGINNNQEVQLALLREINVDMLPWLSRLFPRVKWCPWRGLAQGSTNMTLLNPLNNSSIQSWTPKITPDQQLHVADSMILSVQVIQQTNTIPLRNNHM